MPALLGLDPDSPALPKLCINLQREALEETKMVDGTEEPYQCAGLTEFCQYEDCVEGQTLKAPERPRATPLDREDLATLRLFVDAERRAALAGGKTRVHAAWGIAPKPRNECSKCMDAALTPGARAKHEKNRGKKRGNLCKECGNRAIDGHGKKPPCATCAAKRAAKAAAA